MAIAINSNPGTRFSAHEDLIFVAYEATKATDPNTYVDYKYICDVYINGTREARLKAVPNPENYRGIFNIGTVVRNFVTNQFNPTMSQIRADQKGAGYWFVDVQCKFGEEYNNVIYLNVLEDSIRRYYNHVNGRLFGQLTNLAAYADKPISNRPTSGQASLSDDALFISYWPTDTDAIDVRIRTYNGAGMITSVTNSFTPAATDTMQLFNVAPAAINAVNSGLISANVDYYTVEFLSANITGEDVYRFDLVCYPKFEPVNITFLNKLGGYDTFVMRLVSKQNYSIDKKEFKQNKYTVNSSGSVVYNTGVVYREQIKTFSSQYREQITANSDWLTDAEYQWLAELVFSPEVYIQKSGYFIPVRIKQTNYQPKQYVNDQLTQLEITFDYSDVFNTQYR